MRSPCCLEDRALLLDAPFVTEFAGRRTRLKKQDPTAFLGRVSELLQKQPNWETVVEEWIGFGFESKFRHNYPLRNKKHDERRLAIFVKFFWYLYTEEDAMKYLRSQKLSGYVQRGPYVKEESIDIAFPESPLSILSDDSPTLSHNAAIVDISAIPAIDHHLSLLDVSEQHSVPEQDGIVPMVPQYEAHASTLLEGDPGASHCLPSNTLPREAFWPGPNASAAPTSPPQTRAVEEELPPVGPYAPNASAAEAEFMLHPRPKTPENPPPPKRGRGRPRKPRPVSVTETTAPAIHPLIRPRSPDRLPLVPVSLDNVVKVKTEAAEDTSVHEVLKNWLDRPDIKPAHEVGEEMNLVDLTQEPMLPKPPLHRLPPIWAKARQEVCEAFQWFRSYQGGVYQNNGTVKGYFLSAFSAQRDRFVCDGKLIISHGGGKAESARKDGPTVISKAAEDQRADDSSVRALLENYRRAQPLVLLIDDKYSSFPFDLSSRGVYMAVLGFYRIIHAWAEYQPSTSNANGRVVRWKFAFQWCEGQDEPWWLEQMNSMDAAEAGTAGVDATQSNQNMQVFAPVAVPITPSPLKPANLYFTCRHCGKDSPLVYSAKACLNPTCHVFWMISHNKYLPVKLDYNPDFLSLIDPRPLPISFCGTLLPKAPNPAPRNGITTSYAYSRGWHCRKCGRLACRSAWEHYQCPNCKDTLKIIGQIRPAIKFLSIQPPIPETKEGPDSFILDREGVKRYPVVVFNTSNRGDVATRLTFELPEDKGRIHLIKAPRMSNLEADSIFEAYQQQAADGTLLFRRWPLRSHKLRGPLLTNYFSQNSGETYQYVGGTDNTVPFDRAPSAVVQARDLIERRLKEALGVDHKFNEVLSAAYMEQQKMAFHSDSEKGLGPVVAGLSMGSPALMHFRRLLKYVGPDEARTNALTVILRHGDVLVMEGAGVQDCYEHTVVPCNFRIAATARWIQPNHG
ncbi:2OG-FeII-Oxy-2 domain-containing protein [Favolaschia claudopus]|uniref:2OG-FeII-Oxy-2 domain-containing protein n=1 Tax=Favolaschia claudopus TaxID=2862362 RepID=A0AAW0A0U2_9AGAR